MRISKNSNNVTIVTYFMIHFIGGDYYACVQSLELEKVLSGSMIH